MIHLFNQTISYYNLLVFAVIIGAGIYVGIASRKIKSQEQQFNESVAKELGWNVYFTTPINFLYPYFFIYARTFHQTANPSQWYTYFFEGFYSTLHFKLMPIFTSTNRTAPGNPQWHYLTAELTDTKIKNFDYVLISQAEYDASYVGVFDKYKKVTLEGTEFNNNFVVHSLRPDGAFYALPPDLMAKLIDIKELTFSRLVIEVRENAIFIAGDFKPYVNYLITKDVDKTIALKKEVLSGFVDTANIILNLLKN